MSRCKLATCSTVLQFYCHSAKCDILPTRLYIYSHDALGQMCYCARVACKPEFCLCDISTRCCLFICLFLFFLLCFFFLFFLELYYFCYFSPFIKHNIQCSFVFLTLPHFFHSASLQVIASCFSSSNWNNTREIVERISFMFAIWLTNCSSFCFHVVITVGAAAVSVAPSPSWPLSSR